jgi:nucleoside-diphosphate-sugar epimerase
MSSHLLVTGANGFVGKVLCKELLKHNYSVRAAIRRGVIFDDCSDTVTIPVIGADTDWNAALADVDVVIHLAARVHIMNDSVSNPLAEFRKTNVDATLILAKQAVTAGVKRFIFISSVKVNGEFTNIGEPFKETDLPMPNDFYGLSKYEAEQGLLALAKETGLEVVIIRPPLIYGPGVKANFASMLRVLKKGLPLPLGAIHNKRSFVYIGNLVSLLLLCINHPRAVNQIFFVSDGQDLSTTELLKICANAFNIKAWLIPVPSRLIAVVASVLGKSDIAQRLCGTLQIDISKAKNILGWRPVVTVLDGLEATTKDIRY